MLFELATSRLYMSWLQVFGYQKYRKIFNKLLEKDILILNGLTLAILSKGIDHFNGFMKCSKIKE